MRDSEKVNSFLEKLSHPHKTELEEVINIIINANPKIEEHVKWGAPSFFYKGDMATFAHKTTKNVTFVFHKGAIIKDTTGLLEGDHEERRTASFSSMDEVKAKKEALEKVINDWIKTMDKLS